MTSVATQIIAAPTATVWRRSSFFCVHTQMAITQHTNATAGSPTIMRIATMIATSGALCATAIQIAVAGQANTGHDAIARILAAFAMNRSNRRLA
jgi:hypothetical protein